MSLALICLGGFSAILGCAFAADTYFYAKEVIAKPKNKSIDDISILLIRGSTAVTLFYITYHCVVE